MRREQRGPTSGFDEESVRALALAKSDLDGALMPILIALQDRFGFIDDRAVPIIADVLNLSRAEVHGVVSFYHDFRRDRPASHAVKLCRAEACQALGCEALAHSLETHLGIASGETTGDGQVRLDTVYCLGNCALSPAAEVDGRLIGRATLEAILSALDGSPA